MSLANYKPPHREVPLGDTTLRLEGLSLEHITILVREHLPDLDALYGIFADDAIQNTDDFTRIALSVVSQAPGFTANVIAIASGEPDAAETAMRIPAPKQVEIVLAIGDLTFAEVGGVKKAMGTIAGLLSAMNLKKGKLTQITKKKAG